MLSNIYAEMVNMCMKLATFDKDLFFIWVLIKCLIYAYYIFQERHDQSYFDKAIIVKSFAWVVSIKYIMAVIVLH